jgi:hypothetical protein
MVNLSAGRSFFAKIKDWSRFHDLFLAYPQESFYRELTTARYIEFL